MWHSKENIFIIFLALMVHNNSALTRRLGPMVQTKIGTLRGLRATDGNYSMFMGIPYATVNQSNPFGPSVPHLGFNSTFDAYDDSAICPQLEEFNNTIVGSLDCLKINVYVPNTDSSTKLPVMVWIYGGRFQIGFFGRYIFGPRYLVKQNVILVTINYRVGPYGFMCLGTADVPGNQGLKDQQIGLRWVKDHIDAFGGDTNKITIFGESAGGGSVDFHLLYSKENLFDKVIMQSGVALGHWAVLVPDRLAPIKLAQQLGFSTIDNNVALQFLSITEPRLVIAAQSELNIMFRACVENDISNVEAFVYDHPVNMRKLNVHNIPILIGYNSAEMIHLYEHKAAEEFESSTVFLDALTYPFTFTREYRLQMERQVRQFYIGDEEISIDVKDRLAEFVGDFNFVYPTVRTMNKFLINGATNMYHYLFSYDGDRAYIKTRFNITTPGVAHEDEISYFFDVSFMKGPISTEDQLTIDRVTTMWANFAKYGKPIPEVTELLPVEWPPATKDILYYLDIDSTLEIKKRNFNRRMAMWNLFYIMNEKYQVGYREPEE